MKQLMVILLLLVLSASAALRPADSAETRISIGVTETMDTFNPYADSVSLDVQRLVPGARLSWHL